MTKTDRIQLNVTAAADDTKKFRDWRSEVAGDGADSNMVILDAEIGKLQDAVIFSSTEPEGQAEGDIWNQELASG